MKVYSQSGGCHCVEKQEKEQTQDRSKMQAFQTRKYDCYVVTKVSFSVHSVCAVNSTSTHGGYIKLKPKSFPATSKFQVTAKICERIKEVSLVTWI